MLMGWIVWAVIFTLLFLPAFLQINLGVDAYGTVFNFLGRILPRNTMARTLVLGLVFAFCLLIMGRLDYEMGMGR